MSRKDELVGLLKAFTGALTEMSDIEYEDLLQGKGRLSYQANDYTRQSKNREDKVSTAETTEMADKLSQFLTRDEATEYLTQSMVLKSDLIKLASLLDIYINKSDGKDKIVDKIVESTVGARVRSKAIKDTRLKHANEFSGSITITNDMKGFEKNRGD
jgi:hypothetical protein